GAATTDTTPRLSGSIGAALLAGQTVRVLRNGVGLTGNATVTNGTSWTFTDPGAPDGLHNYTARVEQGGLLGQASSVYPILIDTMAPTVAATVTSMTDGNLGPVPNGGTSSDDTPTVGGSLSAALGATGSAESVQLLRNSSPVTGPVTVTGTTWSYTEPASLAPATYTYQARVIDAAGNLGALSPTPWSVVIDTTQRTAGITAAFNNNGASLVPIANALVTPGSATSDATPLLQGNVNAALLAGQWVRVLRNGAPVSGQIAPDANRGWSYVDSGIGAVTQTFAYTARVESAAAAGAQSAAYQFLIDSIAPTQTVAISALSNRDPFPPVAGGTPADNTIVTRTDDDTPVLRFTLSAALGAGETLSLARNGQSISPVLTACPGISNCLQFTDTSTGVSVPGPELWPNTLPTSVSLPVGVTYNARVVDSVGNLGPAATTKAFNFDYFACDQVRALAGSSTSSHNPIANGRCDGCHQVEPASTATPTPAGRYVAVPGATPATAYYWCRKP
ncbi:MAG: Ig-like domain-containing protein, partial [Rhizobacter sp.]|nr:Ig-like domain-containing protein [Rhizobacter sp.]